MGEFIEFAKGIWGFIDEKHRESRNPPYLPPHILRLFQRFKEAYEDSDMLELADTISEDFSGYIYMEFPTKQALIQGVNDDLRQLKFGCRPFLEIMVYDIAADQSEEFIAIIKVKVSIQILHIPTGLKFNSEKLICHARPEGEYHYWRIHKFKIYKP